MPKTTSTTKRPVKKAVKKPVSGLSITVVDVDGKKKGTMSLQKELFGVPVNKALMAQAVRVYRMNQHQGHAHTKIRGEVEGSTRKIYRQKGTGRARHGSIRAPIFVGGGIVFGPRTRNISRTLPKKMRRVALASTLSIKLRDGSVIVVEGLESLEPKTKHMAQALRAIGAQGRTLLVVPSDAGAVKRMSSNLKNVDVFEAKDLHAYTLMEHKTIVMTKKAVSQMETHFLKK